MNNIIIDFMTFDDFAEIEKTYLEFDNTWSIQNLKSEFENSNSKCIVAKLDKKIVGFASLWFSVDDAHITNIVVNNNYRNQGIGNKLLEKLIELAKIKTSITLEVNINNIVAQKLYNKYGFKNLGTRKRYYNNTDDAYIMTLYF